MRKPTYFLAIALVMILGACANFKSETEVGALNETQAIGSPFTQFLAAEYRDLANYEQDTEMDYPDSLHFARKGLAAAEGGAVMPEPISDWNLRPDHIEVFRVEHARLVSAFDRAGRQIAPETAAVAQASYDCWIEDQEENWDETSFECRDKYYQAIQALEAQLGALPPVADVPAPVTALDVDASEPLQAEDAKYLVFFDFDSSRVEASGESVLDAVAEEVKKQNLNAIVLTGHTDTSGAAAYNKKLALKRANIVKRELERRGVPSNLVVTESKGETLLLVETPDGVREPANRRVEIVFQ